MKPPLAADDLDPRYVELKECVWSRLRELGFRLVDEVAGGLGFGNAYSVFSRPAQDVRLVWDGKDAVAFLQWRSAEGASDAWRLLGGVLSWRAEASGAHWAHGEEPLRSSAAVTRVLHSFCEQLPGGLSGRGAHQRSGAAANELEGIEVRGARPADSAAMAAIYNHYVTETLVTFEEEPVEVAEIERRRRDVVAAGLPWLVAAAGQEVMGYAYATRWRERRGYRFSSEVTIYLRRGDGRRGLGTRLYSELLGELRLGGQRCAIGGIALPNDASVALHEKLGFEKVAHFARIGVKFDQWVDVGYWQLRL